MAVYPLRQSSAPATPRVSWFDTLSNWLTGMMLSNKDKTTGARYFLEQITPDQLEEAYRSDWIARKIISMPAWDATREWRDWQAEQDQIEKIEEVEKQFNVQAKVREALIKARMRHLVEKTIPTFSLRAALATQSERQAAL
jgi:hypothetical protein